VTNQRYKNFAKERFKNNHKNNFTMKKKHQNMVAGIVILITTIILITTFKPIDIKKEQKEITFKEGFNHLEKLSKKYNTSFHTEELNVTMPELDDIPLLLEDIKEFEETLDPASTSYDSQALFLFTNIRKLMLTSQWYFQQGTALGDIGIVNDQEGFSCAESQYIIDGAFLFNESWVYGLYAQDHIDDILYMFKYHPTVVNLVGIDENKTRFFRSDLRNIRHIPINNLQSIDVYCGIRNIKHKTTYQPFQYTRKQIPEELFI
jgi:hypothetical protein